MASSSSLYTNYHRKLLNYANESSNTTVQTCLNFCTTEKNDTVSSSPAGFCPPACLAICPSICHYSLFPPNNNSLSPVQPNTPHNLSPLLITMLIVLASAFLLITFYIIYTKFYHHYYHNSTNSSHTQTRHNRRNNRARVGNDFLDEEQGSTMVFHPIWYIPTVGLNPTVISSISIHKYEKGKMLNEKDCAVCLAEFEEKEELKILPKCNHAFHVMCIDTWLKSHVTCPLCRAHVVPPSDHQLINRDQPGSDSTTTTVVGVEEEVLGRDEDYEVENDLESGLEDKKEQEGNNGKESISSSSNSQRWSLERGAVNLVSRSLSCSAKIFSSRYNNRPSPNS